MSKQTIYYWAKWEISVEDPEEDWYPDWIKKRIVIKFDNENAPHTIINAVLPFSIYDLRQMLKDLNKIYDELGGEDNE